MFRIRRVPDDVLPGNRATIAAVEPIFAEHFKGADPRDLSELAERLRNPFGRQLRTMLYVAENARHDVAGFAIALHEPVIGFFYLDYLAAGSKLSGRGVGSALYQHIRDEARGHHARGLFFECLPDEPQLCIDPTVRKQNAARLRFYERFGARPIVGTKYELPLPDGGNDNLPHLVYDDLAANRPLARDYAQSVVRAILERKYGDLCPADYVREVVESFRDDPVAIRAPRYEKRQPALAAGSNKYRGKIILAVNDQHEIHHIRERGYVESPVRISAILRELAPTGWTTQVAVAEHGLEPVLAVHSAALVEYLEQACAAAPEHKSVYPYVFPVRNRHRPPKDMSVLAGYYCIDTFTPINKNAWLAARRAVDCVLTVADAILAGERLGYALVRPPGHHAERDVFGGFCYLSNAAIGAEWLAQHGRVAMIDVDYHHGNGQQDIFYARSDVLTVSIHGHPEFAYPYFTGFAEEVGTGAGAGFNLNLPLPETITPDQFRDTLSHAIKQIRAFDPQFLVICLGLDPAKGDPTGTWSLGAGDFEQNGRMLGQLQLPTLVVQEGGYRTRTLGINARAFFGGLLAGSDTHVD
jgi:acetoin utilization deacetylase AcuC-like enzyme/ribosomal protein S18 acetylase RimI-like enzyme